MGYIMDMASGRLEIFPEVRREPAERPAFMEEGPRLELRLETVSHTSQPRTSHYPAWQHLPWPDLEG